jgi:hypothetical protein
MLKTDFLTYVDAAADDTEICVVVHSIETDEEISASYDVVADISEYGELMIHIAVESVHIHGNT